MNPDPDEQHVMSLRLPADLAAELSAAAQVEGVSVAASVRQAVMDRLAKLKKDAKFQARVKAAIARNREMLDRLAGQ